MLDTTIEKRIRGDRSQPEYADAAGDQKTEIDAQKGAGFELVQFLGECNKFCVTGPVNSYA